MVMEQRRAVHKALPTPLIERSTALAPSSDSVMAKEKRLVGGIISRLSSALSPQPTSSGGGGGGGSSSGGSSSSNGGSSSSNGGSSGSGSGTSNSGSGSGSSSGSSGSGSNSSGSSGSSSSGGSSSNGGSSSSSNGSSGGSSNGSSSSNSGSSGNSNSNNGGSSSSGGGGGGGGTTSSGSSSSSNNAGSSSNGGGSSGSSSSNKGGSNNGNSNSGSVQSQVQAPVTLANGAVVTPIATLAPTGQVATSTSTLANGSVVVVSSSIGLPSSSDSVVVVMTNSDGQQTTATIPFESALAATNAVGSGATLAQDSHQGTAKKGNTGAIAGAVVAVVLALLVGVCLVFCLRRRRHRRQRERNGGLLYSPSASSDGQRGFFGVIKDRFISRSIRLPSMPSFPSLPSLPSFSSGGKQGQQRQQNRHQRTFTSVSALTYIDDAKLNPVTRPAALFTRMTRYGSFSGGPDRRASSRPSSPPMAEMGNSLFLSIGGPQGISPRSNTSAPLPAALTSINDALNSGELMYDEDQSSLGHGDHIPASHSAPLGRTRTSQGTFIMIDTTPPPTTKTTRSSHSESDEVAVDVPSVHLNPFASPTPSQDGSSVFPTSSSHSSPQLADQRSIRSATSSSEERRPVMFFDARSTGSMQFLSPQPVSDDGMSADTFGLPHSPTMSRNGSGSSFGIPYYGGPPSQEIPISLGGSSSSSSSSSSMQQSNSPNLLSPSSARLSAFPGLARQPTVSAITEEDSDVGGGIPDEILQDAEPKRRPSFFGRLH